MQENVKKLPNRAEADALALQQVRAQNARLVAERNRRYQPQPLPRDVDEILDVIEREPEGQGDELEHVQNWVEPVEAAANGLMNSIRNWHSVIGVERQLFDELIDMYRDEFNNLTWHGTPVKRAKEVRVLDARVALFITLYWLRQYLTGANMQMIFNCHPRTLARIYRRVLKSLVTVFQGKISMPSPEVLDEMRDDSLDGTPLEDVVCFVDGTIFETPRSTRNLTLTGPDQYYSGAKKVNGLNMLAIVDRNGHILLTSRCYPASKVDQHIWNRERMREFFVDQPFGIAGDGGFAFDPMRVEDKIIGVTPTRLVQTQLAQITDDQKKKNSRTQHLHLQPPGYRRKCLQQAQGLEYSWYFLPSLQTVVRE